jgi:hypothetical protein
MNARCVMYQQLGKPPQQTTRVLHTVVLLVAGKVGGGAGRSERCKKRATIMSEVQQW